MGASSRACFVESLIRSHGRQEDMAKSGGRETASAAAVVVEMPKRTKSVVKSDTRTCAYGCVRSGNGAIHDSRSALCLCRGSAIARDPVDMDTPIPFARRSAVIAIEPFRINDYTLSPDQNFRRPPDRPVFRPMSM